MKIWDSAYDNLADPFSHKAGLLFTKQGLSNVIFLQISKYSRVPRMEKMEEKEKKSILGLGVGQFYKGGLTRPPDCPPNLCEYFVSIHKIRGIRDASSSSCYRLSQF